MGKFAEVGIRGGHDHRIHHLTHGVELDEHVLDVALNAHLVARVELLGGEHAKFREQRTGLLRDELLQCVGRAADIRQAALLRLLDPFLRVVVALEPDWRTLLECLAHDLQDRVVYRFCFV